MFIVMGPPLAHSYLAARLKLLDQPRLHQQQQVRIFSPPLAAQVYQQL